MRNNIDKLIVSANYDLILLNQQYFTKLSGEWWVNACNSIECNIIIDLQTSNNSGNLAVEYSYDAWGRMRNPANWQAYAQGSQPTMPYGGRCYTGHEHLNDFGLINMNARLYDPLLGRFLGPDPFVGSGMTGDFNRYIYAKDNPMMYTDPDGKFAWLAFLAGTLIYQGISYFAGVRDTGWKDWTPRLSTVIGGGYSGSNGYYGGMSIDGGTHFTNLGWKDGLTAGTSNGGMTQMNSVVQPIDPIKLIVEQEQEIRKDYVENKKLDLSWTETMSKGNEAFGILSTGLENLSGKTSFGLQNLKFYLNG